MSASVKVFRIPDGNGGTKYQIMNPDGSWTDTDAEGTPLTEQQGSEANVPPSGESVPVSSARKKKKARSEGYVYMSVKMTQEDYDLLSKYIYWSSLQREPLSRCSLAYRLLMEKIRKDREFQQYLKNKAAF